MSLDSLQARLNIHPVDRQYPHERVGRRCCELALQALREGSYGVGAVLLDERGEPICEGYNRVFSDGFHSARHAEMELLERFEADYPEPLPRQSLTLVVSLEPCPMCLGRLLLSGIGRLLYLVPDPDGGMVRHGHQLPPAFRNLLRLQPQAPAQVSNELRALAKDLAGHNLAQLRQRWCQAVGR